jgi:hypothetical protein
MRPLPRRHVRTRIPRNGRRRRPACPCSKLEAVLYKIDEDLILQHIFNPPRGIHARVGGIGAGAGFGGGAGYQFLGVPFDLRTSAAGSLKGVLHRRGIAPISRHQERGPLHMG